MNSVLYWNAVLLEVSRRDFTRGFVNSQNPGPIATSRAMAMVHIAIREALALPNQAASSYYSPPPPPGGALHPRVRRGTSTSTTRWLARQAAC